MYTYKVSKVIKVYDGDTITVLIDLGFYIHVEKVLRLNRIDAPEIRGADKAAGIRARNFLEQVLEEADEIIVETIKDKKGKYGRYLAEIYADGVNVNDLLVEVGLAKPYKTRKV